MLTVYEKERLILQEAQAAGWVGYPGSVAGTFAWDDALVSAKRFLGGAQNNGAPPESTSYEL